MPLCFIEPQDAIRVIAESVGREARRQLVGAVVRAWVDDIPEQELSLHYAKAIADLDQDDLHLLAAWHASLEVGQPIPNTDFLVGVFPSLGENRREALKIAAGFRGGGAFQAGVSEGRGLNTGRPRPPANRPLIPWTTDGGPGPAAKRSSTVALKLPPEIVAAFVVWTWIRS